ncbi:MAG: family 10 glycosylhydrolase [bacterium]
METKPRVRAVWVSVLGPGLRSPQEIRDMVDAARRANFNVIVAQVRRSGATYFNSTLEPRDPILKDQPDFDPLAFLLKEARDTTGGKKPLQVHAWFNAFAVGSQKDLLDAKPAPLIVTHPDWFTQNATGEAQTSLDPGVPDVQDHVIALIEECLKKYDVDGVNLDFIRYFGQDMGYNPVALERFHRLTGRNDTPTSRDAQWSDFRREQVTNFVRRCGVSVRTLRPDAMFSVDAVGFGRPPLKDFSDTSGYITVFQDWAGWAENGDVDLVLRMGYKRESVEVQARDFRGWADFTRSVMDRSDGRLLTAGIGGYFNKQSDMLNQYREAQKRGLGTCIFSYNRPTQESSDDTSLTAHKAPAWDAIGKEIYPVWVPAPRPVWRNSRACVAGFAKDASGKVVDGGKITLEGAGLKTRSVNLALCDGSGFFAFVDVDPGAYTIRAAGTSVDGKKVSAGPGVVSWIR